MDRSLVGGQVQRIAVGEVGAREVATLQVRVPGETVYVVVAGGLGVGVIDEALRARLRAGASPSPSPSQPHWRARLENARIVAMDSRGVDFVRENRRMRARDASGTLRLDLDAEAVETQAERHTPDDPLEPRQAWDALVARGTRMVEQLEHTGTRDRRDALRRALAKAVVRIERRVEAVRGDLAKMDLADAAAERARLFVVEAARAPRGATSLQAVDWSRLGPDGEALAVEMALDPAKSAQEQLDALFRKARRMKDGMRVASARLENASRARDRLAELRAAITDPTLAPDFDAIEATARRCAPRDFKLAAGMRSSKRATPSVARPPHRTFVGHAEAPIYVGRGALHNDALTVRVARPHDLWLHAKGHTGAHVVVPLHKGVSCPPELLVDAAHLAAHFSDARGERIVDVQYTQRRHIRKPRGSAPGAVMVDREKVLVLRVDDERLRRLLSTEVDV
jgi:hypothetical protein